MKNVAKNKKMIQQFLNVFVNKIQQMKNVNAYHVLKLINLIQTDLNVFAKNEKIDFMMNVLVNKLNTMILNHYNAIVEKILILIF
jgi:hypothetical protein